MILSSFLVDIFMIVVWVLSRINVIWTGKFANWIARKSKLRWN